MSAMPLDQPFKQTEAVPIAEAGLNAATPPKGGGRPAPAKNRSKKTSKRSGRRRQARSKPRDKKSAQRRPYPRVSLEEALRIPFVLKEKNGGNPWPPADVAAAVNLSAKNPDFFYLAAASRDFGFTERSRDSAQISLTDF